MTETFACPECGSELTLIGATPGREVRCAHCEARVEVPYLPRDGVWTRPRFRKARPRWAIPLAWTAVALLALIVAIVAATRFAASRGRHERDAILRDFLREADVAERGGRPGRALSEVEAAIAYLRSNEPEGSTRLAELDGRRDALSVREAERRLSASESAEPEAALGDLLSLRARAKSDRALDAMSEAISRAIEATRRRAVDADLAAAGRARDAGRPLEAIALASRALTAADRLEVDRRAARDAADRAEALAGPLLKRFGVVVVQVPGQYTIGTPESYDATLGARAADALRRQGYAPRPPSGPARSLWDRHAGYRFEYQLNESHNGLYLQSLSQTSEIRAVLHFRGGSRNPWTEMVTGRTQVPLPDVSAFVGSRLAVSDHRDPEAERRFYENARRAVLDTVDLKLRTLPTP